MGIEIVTINVPISVEKTELDYYGGADNYIALISDILNRYSYAEYFDEDLVELIMSGEQIHI